MSQICYRLSVNTKFPIFPHNLVSPWSCPVQSQQSFSGKDSRPTTNYGSGGHAAQAPLRRRSGTVFHADCTSRAMASQPCSSSPQIGAIVHFADQHGHSPISPLGLPLVGPPQGSRPPIRIAQTAVA
ncbi:hypothetical protein SNOG_09096 [Parastagonospora nodorum SN15]|uniref:Uncharacterized protein n=1 Tax=Phaeosphaeria nodorum (strain SN15 / ATCC MYA-4574 / FGSC 10173) TaxID=321614 RepID=Q0UGL8_PHANO|nr:hypothetical protein SNOG_09096 [Parastagonospora nodorum SN15]EAT83288.1 hypothetical protein SNOG_09096 [Parastagonospora nodorum SN15]